MLGFVTASVLALSQSASHQSDSITCNEVVYTNVFLHCSASHSQYAAVREFLTVASGSLDFRCCCHTAACCQRMRLRCFNTLHETDSADHGRGFAFIGLSKGHICLCQHQDCTCEFKVLPVDHLTLTSTRQLWHTEVQVQRSTAVLALP